MKALALAVALAAIARAELAAASSCGGGGGAGGGSGGSGGFAWTNALACEDESDVVGFRRCTKAGAWGSRLVRPAILVETGVMVQRFGSLLDRQTGTVAHGGESFTYRVNGSAHSRGHDTAVVAAMRIGLGLPYGLHTAVELDLGGLAQVGQVGAESTPGGAGRPELAQEQGMVVGGLGAFGVRGATSFGRFGVELAGGVRVVSYSFTSRYHDCVQNTGVTAVAPVAEARARGELWVTPWVTAGVMAGASVLERGAWTAGVFLGVHGRSFGGDR